MQPVAYRFSQNYIQAKTRGPIHGAIVFILLIACIALALGLSKSWHPAIAATLFFVAASIMLHKNRKLSREAATHLPQVVVELSPDVLSFAEPGGRHELPISSITSVVVDSRAQEPRIVYLQRTSGDTILIEGLDRLSQFVQQISQIVGTSKVKELKWWQMPPR
jgi:hypothetical protein